MKPRYVALGLAVALLTSTVQAAESTLEALDAGTALSDVRASTGIVFVDLYADW